MSDFADRIDALSPAQVVRVLTAITRARVHRGTAVDLAPDAALVEGLAATADTVPDAAASAEDVARASLLLLAADPTMAPALDGLIDNPPPEDFLEPVGIIALGAAALVVLQSYIKIERDKTGKWTCKFEKKAMSESLRKQLISKLGRWFPAA